MKDKNEDKVNESSPGYGKRLIIDSSYKDQENDNYDYWLSLTPGERIRTATMLIRAIYGEMPKRDTDRPIYFD